VRGPQAESPRPQHRGGRWAEGKRAAAEALANEAKFRRPPGQFHAERPLEIVQVDHSRC
jgi:hypothetical protein